MPSTFATQYFMTPNGLAFATALLLTTMVLGCGYQPENHSNRVELSGTVTYQGTPLPGGTITVMSKQNRSQIAATSIREDGTFKVPDAPLGSAVISVSTQGQHRYEPDKIPKIPAKYGNPKTSGFSTEIHADRVNVIDLKLD